MADRGDRTKTDFASRKFAWTEAVCLDARLSAHRKTVGVLLLAMVNQADGYAWPALATLADLSNGSEKATRDAINDLEKLGYLKTQRGGGRVEGGRPITSRYWPIWVASKSPVTDALNERRERLATPEPSPQSGGSSGAEPSPPGAEPSLPGAFDPHPTVTQTRELNPTTGEPGSDPNGSASAVASASLSRTWKGSEGEPLSSDFPDDEAMAEAQTWTSFGSVTLDLTAERERFRRHHYSVRCLQRDWMQSWERWISAAIDREESE